MTDFLKPEIQQFIIDNTDADLVRLALTKNPFPQIPFSAIISQIAARQKAKSKLPHWFETSDIIYPSKVSVEQTSSAQTAVYKASLISGKSLIDLTGGFGVDSFYFSKRFEKVIHCEQDETLHKIAQHNFKKLDAENIISIGGESTAILENLNSKFDWIYIDPSRRSEKGRVFQLSDCAPNVPENLDFYFNFSNNILIKTAPLLDITAALHELRFVKTVYVIALDNDVKELLFEIHKGSAARIEIKTVNLKNDDDDQFDFFIDDDTLCTVAEPASYLYEPNAAIMKSGSFEQVGVAFGLSKLHRHSHLYTSDELVAKFPGRIFKIAQNLPYNKASMKQFQNTKANVTTRNFAESVESIRTKWKIKDGGDTYCFFTTNINNDKIVLICTKIQRLQ